MAPKSTRTSPRAWSRDEHQGRAEMTIGDLCRAIEERRIPITRQDDEYVLTMRDLRRWLDGRAPSDAPRRCQRPAS